MESGLPHRRRWGKAREKSAEAIVVPKCRDEGLNPLLQGASREDSMGIEQRLAVHPRAGRPGQRFTLPDQWSGLELGDSRPKQEPLATQVEEIEVEQRPLEHYQALVAGGGR